MKIINQSHKILNISKTALQDIEVTARTCYKSEDRITEGSAEKLVSNLIKREHLAILEFGDITVRFITNRGVSHELVRHRLCSFAQESTRYVKYNSEMEFIRPVWLSEEILGEHFDDSFDPILIPSDPEFIFIKSLCEAEESYCNLLDKGWKAQQAREVLPNALKTEIVMKGNIREWRHIFSLRCDKAAHPQMVALMRPLLDEVKTIIPIIFDDI